MNTYKEYKSLVERTAYTLVRRLPDTVDVQDLIQEGWMGLLECQKRYDPSLGAEFGAYALIRIRGAMLDWIRGQCKGTRGAVKGLQKVSKVQSELEQLLLRKATHSELAAACLLPLNEYFQIIKDVECINLIIPVDAKYLTDLSIEYDDVNSLALDFHSFLGTLDIAFRELFIRYYLLGETLSSIGKDHNLTESRMCQLKGQLDAKVRHYFGSRD